MSMKGRVALVFGGANGIGRAGAEALAERGATVVVADLDVASGQAVSEKLAAGGRPSSFVRVNILEDESVAGAYRVAEERHGRVDVVVNSAGFITQSGDDAFERNIDMLLHAVYRSVRLGTEVLRRQGGGSIINIASIAGVTGSIGAPGYGPSKHGVVGLTKDYALSTAAEGIRVNVICPGYVWTQQTAAFAPDEAASAALIKDKLRVPMRRWGKPEVIGSVIAFLASDEASFMTGSVVVVDGGLTARR